MEEAELAAILEAASQAHERFQADSLAIDEAYKTGTLGQWIKEQLARMDDGRSGTSNSE